MSPFKCIKHQKSNKAEERGRGKGVVLATMAHCGIAAQTKAAAAHPNFGCVGPQRQGRFL